MHRDRDLGIRVHLLWPGPRRQAPSYSDWEVYF